MEAFLIYQLKVAVVAAVLYLLYRWTLGKQTFHGFNRIMLLIIAALSFILPLCRFNHLAVADSMRNALHLKNTAAVTSTPSAVSADAFDITPQLAESSIAPASTDASVITDASASNASVSVQADASAQPQPQAQNRVGAFRIVAIILFAAWCIGFIWLMGKKVISLMSIRKLISEGRYTDREDGCDVIESDRITQPMNWMHCIMMPHDWLEKENQAVWRHELSHANKAHSVDLLVLDIMQLFQWFNPIMYLLYKEMELIHEYEADRAVLQSGANARQYKLMLVEAVAQNRGYAMASWLRQTNLKKRIDMMQKHESNGWNRLRALFIPLVAVFFLVLNTAMTSAQDQNFHWDPFQDGKTWVYENGMAKVLTVDGVQANMKTEDVADYLAKYKPVKTTRMTLRYMYDVDDLTVAYPLAKSLADKGIHVSIANNDDMLTEMTMPEYRTPAIYDLGDGQFRFELNCNRKMFVHGMLLIGRDLRDEKNKGVTNPSLTGTLDEVMKWIDLFDGHGLAIYPKTMTAKEVDRIAKAVWKRGLDQVSVVSDVTESGQAYGFLPCDYRITTIVPKNFSFEKKYGNISALEAVKKMHADQTSAYYGKGQRVVKPQFFAGDAWHEITDVINGPDELILITRIDQGSYQWVIGFSDCEIEANGVRYKMTRSEGMEGFESTYFWSPTFGYFYQTLHFPPIPENVQTINFYESNPTNTITKLQVVPGIDIFEGVRIVKFQEDEISYVLQTTHVNEDPGIRDVVSVKRVDFTDKETTIYCGAMIRNAHSYPGHISSDFKLRLGSGRVLEPIRYEGVPVDQNFDRHGDWVDSPFQLIFPPISQEEWDSAAPLLTGSVLHEPCTLLIRGYVMPTLVRLEALSDGLYALGMSEAKSGKDIDAQIVLGVESPVVATNKDGLITLSSQNNSSKSCTIGFTGVRKDGVDLHGFSLPASSEVVITCADGKSIKGYGIMIASGDDINAIILYEEGDDVREIVLTNLPK